MKKLYFLIIISFINCKTESKQSVDFRLQKKLISQTVFITGTSDEKGFDEKISFHDDSLFYVGKFENVNKEIEDDKVTRTLHGINNAKLLRINAFGENTFYRTAIIVSPNDTITYKLKNGKLKFFGKNEAHYNFYLEMDREYDAWSKLYLNKYNPDFEKYKQQCDSLYNKRLNFFNSYIKKHPKVSDKFIEIVKEDLLFEYLVNLIKPRSEKQSSWTINTQEDLMNIYDRKNKKENEFFNINEYLNNITLEDVNKPRYIRSIYFQSSLVSLLRQYFVKGNNQPFTINSFKDELTFLQESFNPIIVERITARLIKTYFDKGFGKDEKTHKFFIKVIRDYKKTVKDPSIINIMVDIEQELSSINKKLPKELNELVLNLSKDTVSFSYALQQKRIKVIDFWASWCGPCIDEIIVSKDKRERLAKKYNVDFLYLSTDKDTQKWIDKSIELYTFLPDAKQYKILNLKRSRLIKYLNLKNSFGMTIPRYVILNENNVIIDNNAPKPSDNSFEDVLIKNLYQ